MNIDATNLHNMSNALRATALRALLCAKSGHIGIALGAADIVTMIYAVILNQEYDKFILSAGHGSVLLYSVLKLSGYRIGDLDSFRRLGGLPGHPEFGIAGVSATTGPLPNGRGKTRKRFSRPSTTTTTSKRFYRSCTTNKRVNMSWHSRQRWQRRLTRARCAAVT